MNQVIPGTQNIVEGRTTLNVKTLVGVYVAEEFKKGIYWEIENIIRGKYRPVQRDEWSREKTNNNLL